MNETRVMGLHFAKIFVFGFRGFSSFAEDTENQAESIFIPEKLHQTFATFKGDEKLVLQSIRTTANC